MALTVMVSPSSGDDKSTLFASPDAGGEILESVNKGTILKVTGTNGIFYEVAYETNTPNEAQGGTGKSATIVAYPNTAAYDSKFKYNIIGKFNNGTTVEILDDSTSTIFKVKGISTEGLIEGWVNTKFIYRDFEDTPPVVDPEPEVIIDPLPQPIISKSRSLFSSPTRNTPMTVSESVPTKGIVLPNIGLKCWSSPSYSSDHVGNFNWGAPIDIHEVKGGWYNASSVPPYGNGDFSDVWVEAKYIKVTGSETVASVPKADVVEVKPTPAVAYNLDGGNDEFFANFGNIEYNAALGLSNDTYYRALSDKFLYALGSPPRYNSTIDPQYSDGVFDNLGRIHEKTLLSNASYLSLCPGKVKMFPDGLFTAGSSMYQSALELAENTTDVASALLEKIQGDTASMYDSRCYQFYADTADYARHLNTLCRSVSLMLGIGDELMPGTSVKLKYFNYEYWTIRKQYNYSEALEANGGDTSMFADFWSGLITKATSALDSAVSDNTYINFFLHAAETSIAENITTSVTSSPLESMAESVSSLGRTLNYFMGSGFSLSSNDATQALQDMLTGDGNDILGGLVNLGDNILKGGRMVLPKMVADASFGRSMGFNLKFVSPYGDKKSVFFKCLVPICHLLALALPKQLADNMYTFPFVIRGGQVGHVNVDLGVISNLSINRGGADESSWTVDNICTEWDVSLEITPLIDDLMITSSNNPVLFLKNEGLLDYLSNFCGFDMMANNIDTKLEMMRTSFENIIMDIPNNMENKITDDLYNVFNSVFRL